MPRMLRHLFDLVTQRAADHPNAVALGGQHGLGWRTITSAQLLDLTNRLAAELAAIGVSDGDRVVLWVPNHWQTPVYLFALWKVGAIPVPFDREMNPEGAGRIIDTVEPRCAIVGHGERPPWAERAEIVEWWEPGTRGVAAQDTQHVRPMEGLAAIFFTSGTTGSPKGCMITHDNLCSQVDAIQHTVPLDTSCRLASILPLSHLFELTVGLLYPLSRGAAVHYVPSRRGPDILRVLKEQRITHIIAVPQLLMLMGSGLDDRVRKLLPGPLYRAAHALAARLPLGLRRIIFMPVHRALGGHLRTMAAGGAALPADTQLLWERMGVRVLEGYGTSECSPVIACAAADGSTPLGSVGRPLQGTEVRLSDESELIVRGPNVMKGYWKDPERTAEVLLDGWYATGDMASIDGDGTIRISGRVKDLIVLPSGMKVWPQDVEDVLREHADIKDAVVLAVPGTSGGATLHAYVIPRGGADGLEGVVAECNARLAVHQRVATASWWDEPDFPRTSTLKVRRNLLPLPQLEETVKVESVLATDDPVAQAIAGIGRVVSVGPRQTLAELGLDSMGLVELAIALEGKTGRGVSEEDLRLDLTVEQVRAMLLAAQPADADGAAPESGAWTAQQPLWPYTWGRVFRVLAAPIDLLYRLTVTRTIVLGGVHLTQLPARVVLAGTHHGFPDLPLIRCGLGRTPARHLSTRLAVAAGAGGWGGAGLLAWWGILGFGLYPLRQYREREESLRRLVQVADAGNAVLIFPQGVHARPEQERAGDPAVRFRTGAAHITMSLDASVVPFGLAGTEAIMPVSLEGYTGPVIAGGIPVSLTKGPLAIAFGPTLTPKPGENAEQFTDRLQAACYGLTRDAEAALIRYNRPSLFPGDPTKEHP